MSLVFHCANFLLKKDNYRCIVLLGALVTLLGGAAGAIISLPLPAAHTTSLKLKLATINDGILSTHSLISTKPIHIFSNDEIASLKIDCVSALLARDKQAITLSNLPRGSDTLLVSITNESASFECLEMISEALINDQNRRLAEYVQTWRTEKDILESRLAHQDQRNLDVLRLSTDLAHGVPAREPVFEELYKVKWSLASARESLIATPARDSQQKILRRLFLYGLYGALSVGGGLLFVLFSIWLIFTSHQ